MAYYKVPQDVEADDKLIGPFSFRQFIYLIIVAISLALGWGLFLLLPPLAILPLPIILLFGALALPLRKDQPMEIYLAAVLSFYLKPRKRLWQADGIQSLVEITAPKIVEIQRAKNLSQTEAERRLSYLADIVDTGGWAIRGVAATQVPSPMQNDVYFEAQQTEDILSTDGGVARTFDTMINQSDLRHRQQLMETMRQAAPAPAPAPAPIIIPSNNAPQSPQTPPFSIPLAPPVYIPEQASTQELITDSAPKIESVHVEYNPYPNSMHQSIVTPLSEQRPVQQIQPPVIQPLEQPVIYKEQIPQQQVEEKQAQAINTSENVPSPDIMNLADNHYLSIETIAHEANRIHQQEQQRDDKQEVVIPLR